MSVAFSDGETPGEAQWIKDRMLLLGLTENERRRMFELDCRAVAVEPIVTELEANAARANRHLTIRRIIFYDALTMANQDQYSLDEHLSADRLAKTLKLTEEEVDTIEAICDKERLTRNRKIDLFDVFDPEAEGGSSFTQNGPITGFTGNASAGCDGGILSNALSQCLVSQDSHEAYKDSDVASRPRRHALNRLTYGTAVPLVAQRNATYIDALLFVAGGEGHVSESEQAWLRDRCTVQQLSSDRFAKFFDAIDKDGNVTKHAACPSQSDLPESVAIAVLYDAVTLACVDACELTDAKKANAHQIAVKLGLESDFCDEIIDIVQVETSLQSEKLSLFGRRDPS